MFRRRLRVALLEGEHPSVEPVQALLSAAGRRVALQPDRSIRRPLAVRHAAYLCACESVLDSPIWLIAAVGDDGVVWGRSDYGFEPDDVVDTAHITGGHPAPEGVLAWLRGAWPDPWNGACDYPSEVWILDDLRARVRRAPGTTDAEGSRFDS